MNQKRIGQNICALRRQCGLTQAQLAQKLNISTDHISHVEIGSGNISTSLVIQICRALGVTPNDVLTGEYGAEEYLCEGFDGNVLSLEGMTPENQRIMAYLYEYMLRRKQQEYPEID